MKSKVWNLIFLICTYTSAVGQNLYKEVIDKPGNSKLMMYKEFPSKHVASRQVEVWLPPSYVSNGDKKYPVIYMHDGQNIFNPKTSTNQIDWGLDEILTQLTNEGKMPEVIVVAAWNTPLRIAEYMPQKAFDLLSREQLASIPNVEGFKPLSDQYLKFIVDELKPYIDKTYPTLPDRDNTAIMGASMGGLISLYAISEYPEVFGYAGCMSTHFPIGNGIMLDYMKDNLPDPRNHKIYFDFGTRTLDAQYEPYQKKADKIMKEHGWEENENWVTKKFEGHDHSEKAWRSRVHIPLLFFFGYEDIEFEANSRNSSQE